MIGTNETTNDEVARDLLVSWSWAMCVATKRDGRPVPIINLFDDDQCASALTLQRAMRRPYIVPALLARAWGSCGTALSDACPLWNEDRQRSRRRLREKEVTAPQKQKVLAKDLTKHCDACREST